ncbi:hypothetical protein VPH35_098526 [Triticum aestivum]
MGLLAFNRLMSMQRGRHRRPTQGRNGSVTSVAKRKGSHDDNSRSDKKLRYSGPSLPEAVWHHIHSLLPLRDAAHVACMSHSFRRSWRCFPNLNLTRETLGLKGGVDGISSKIALDLAKRTDHILKNHSGVGVKALKLEIREFPFFSTSCDDLNRWLGIAVRPGIEELYLQLHSSHADVYNFPCTLLLDGSGKSIRHLHLGECAFRPTAGVGCLRSLNSLELYDVHITGDVLMCLLSSSVALEKLTLAYCDELIFLEIPSLLQRLSHLVVHDCLNLEVIKNKAPYSPAGAAVASHLLQNLDIDASGWDVIHYAGAKLPCMVPNLEALNIHSSYVRDILVVPGKFLHLQHLCIGAFTPDYDYFCLASLLDACPSLETFILSAEPDCMEQESVLGDSFHDLRQMPGHMHRNIKDVQIIGFCSAKSMVELTCHILENSKLLKRLKLSTCYNGEILCSYNNNGKCLPMSRGMIMEAHKALLAVERYILGKVPSTVELKVEEPCSRCNALEI